MKTIRPAEERFLSEAGLPPRTITSGVSLATNGGKEIGSNSTAKSTAASAATTSARSSDGVIGRPGRPGQPGLRVTAIVRVRFGSRFLSQGYLRARASLFDQANVAGVQVIEDAAREHHSLAVAFPLGASENQFILRNHATQISAPPFTTTLGRKRTILTCARKWQAQSDEALGTCSRDWRSDLSASGNRMDPAQ